MYSIQQLVGAYINSSQEILKELVGNEFDENSDCEMDDEDSVTELIEE